jgi:hypothetical protein
MSVFDMPAARLALVIAVSTALGGVLAALIDNFLLDANVEHQANVQLVELAIGILSEPVEPSVDGLSFSDTPEAVLRGWAVDTLNAVALVQFDEAARELLVTGRVQFNWADALQDTGRLSDIIRDLETLSGTIDTE